MEKTTIKLPIFPEPIALKAVPLRFVKDASEHWIVDTDSLLKILPNLEAVVYRLDKGYYKLAVPEVTIRQTVVHLDKSYFSKKKEHQSTYGVETGMRNLVRFLKTNVLLVSHPKEIPKKLREKYEKYGDDPLLAYVSLQGRFKGVVTHDRILIAKIKNDLRILAPERLIRTNSSIDP